MTTQQTTEVPPSIDNLPRRDREFIQRYGYDLYLACLRLEKSLDEWRKCLGLLA